MLRGGVPAQENRSRLESQAGLSAQRTRLSWKRGRIWSGRLVGSYDRVRGGSPSPLLRRPPRQRRHQQIRRSLALSGDRNGEADERSDDRNGAPDAQSGVRTVALDGTKDGTRATAPPTSQQSNRSFARTAATGRPLSGVCRGRAHL